MWASVVSATRRSRVAAPVADQGVGPSSRVPEPGRRRRGLGEQGASAGDVVAAPAGQRRGEWVPRSPRPRRSTQSASRGSAAHELRRTLARSWTVLARRVRTRRDRCGATSQRVRRPQTDHALPPKVVPALRSCPALGVVPEEPGEHLRDAQRHAAPPRAAVPHAYGYHISSSLTDRIST